MMPTLDPRSIVSFISFEDNAGSDQAGVFQRSATWLQNVSWVDAPMIVSPLTPLTTPNLIVPNPQDFQSVQVANLWNSSQAMTSINTRLPKAVEKIMFLKAGLPFINNLYLDWTPGVTSTDVQFSFRDNSLTPGDFLDSTSGTIPAFVFPGTATYGLTARRLRVTLRRRGQFNVGLRILDNSGNYSLYEMIWIVE